MRAVKHCPVVTAPVRRRKRLSGLSAEAAIAAQVLGFRKALVRPHTRGESKTLCSSIRWGSGEPPQGGFTRNPPSDFL